MLRVSSFGFQVKGLRLRVLPVNSNVVPLAGPWAKPQKGLGLRV